MKPDSGHVATEIGLRIRNRAAISHDWQFWDFVMSFSSFSWQIRLWMMKSLVHGAE